MTLPAETIFLIILGISYVALLILPFSIALLYERTFKKHVFPYLFVVAIILLSISFFVYPDDFFRLKGSIFFAAGGVSLAITSIRLYMVMTGGH